MVRVKLPNVPLGVEVDDKLPSVASPSRKRPTASHRRNMQALTLAEISKRRRLTLLEARPTIEKMVNEEDQIKKGGDSEVSSDDESSENESSEKESKNESGVNEEGKIGEVSKDKDAEEGEDSSEEESESEIGGNEEGKIGEVSKDKDDEEGEDSSEEESESESSESEDKTIRDVGKDAKEGEDTSEEDSESESGEKEKEQNQDDSEEENTSQGERENEDEEQVENQQPARKTTPRKKSLPDVRVVAGINEDGPFPGGPQDTSILRSFYDHVALKIWLGQVRLIVRFHYHAKKMLEWNVDPKCTRFWSKVNASGLSTLVHSYKNINKVVVCAFIERWQPETNSFHLPFGEMTITLDDVLQITGLSITGKILDGSSAIKREEASKLLQEGLGLDKNVVEQELERCKGGDCIIQTDWIKENFKGKENVEDDGKVDCAVRAYLMYMIGCVLLPDKSGTMMSASYMRFLLDISKIHEYAWGASALAYLYRQMGFSSRCDVKQLAGYLPLLEVWVYEHFPIAKGILNPNYVEEMPRMRRWKAWAGSGRSLGDRVCDFRQELDLLTPQSVVWDPYKDLRSSSCPLQEIVFYSGCLCCLEEVEGYYPDRVLRQFGRIQTIPEATLKPLEEYRPRTGRNYKLLFSASHACWWSTWDNHVLNITRRGESVLHPWDCDTSYLSWFTSNSHPRVQSPTEWKTTHPYSSETDNIEKAKQILKQLLESEGLHCSRKALIDIRDAYNLMCGQDMGIGCDWNLDNAIEENDEQATTRKRKQPVRENVTKATRGRGRGRAR